MTTTKDYALVNKLIEKTVKKGGLSGVFNESKQRIIQELKADEAFVNSLLTKVEEIKNGNVINQYKNTDIGGVMGICTGIAAFVTLLLGIGASTDPGFVLPTTIAGSLGSGCLTIGIVDKCTKSQFATAVMGSSRIKKQTAAMASIEIARKLKQAKL